MKKSVVTDLFKHLLEHWVICLLGSGGIVSTVLGWLFRTHLKNWLLSEHSLEMDGWMWVVSILIVGILPLFIFWICKKLNRKVLYREGGEILVVLEDKLRDLERQEKNQVRIDFRLWDKKLSLTKGSAERLLPQLVDKDTTWRIKNRSGNAMTIIRDDPRATVLKRVLGNHG
jgi:hypothetical protein